MRAQSPEIRPPFSAAGAAASLDMTAIQRGLFRRLGRRRNRREYLLPDSPLAPAGKAKANFIRNGFFSVAVSKIRFNAWPESFGGRPKSGFASNPPKPPRRSPPASLPLSSGSSPFGRLKEFPHTPAMDRQPVPPQNPNNSFRAFALLQLPPLRRTHERVRVSLPVSCDPRGAHRCLSCPKRIARLRTAKKNIDLLMKGVLLSLATLGMTGLH
jgi:hypothetical protein